MGRKYRYFACDFETTVLPEGVEQYSTEVWASAVVELYTEDVKILHSIRETWEYFEELSQDSNIVCFYHNLKFDGSFWLNFLLLDLKMTQAADIAAEPFAPEYQGTDITWHNRRFMRNDTFAYHIANNGLWYYITIKHRGKIIELRDSLKLIPFTIRKIGHDFQTKHQKLDMEYTGRRYAGCPITDEEVKYISCDALVLKEALEIMFNNGHKRLTIGACCLDEYRTVYSPVPGFFDEQFPDVYDLWLNEQQFGVDNVGRYVWRAYHGGWCYVVRGKENQVKHNGITLDVNGLYSYVMHSKSGNIYPIGYPTVWTGNYIPQEACDGQHYYFVRIKTRFYIKEGMLPTIQIKGSMFYPATKWLDSSDREVNGKSTAYTLNFNNELADTRVEMTLTMTDFRLLKEHYNLFDFEILDGVYFNAETHIFDDYIDKYQEIKRNSKGAKRTLAKLFLNNLYGKMAAGQNSSFKFAYVKDDGVLGFYQVRKYDRKPGYIPVGAAITSYARAYTIRAAQANYYGADKPGFIYADTDSIHCDLPVTDVKGVYIDSYDLGAWKAESYWDDAIFVRQKTYIEHTTHADGILLNKPKYVIKCAGMPDRCKRLLEWSLEGAIPELTDEGLPVKLLKKQKDFLIDENGNLIRRSIADFKVGLQIYGKLVPRMIKGGVLLVNTTYELR